jgi:hypothetical protein
MPQMTIDTEQDEQTTARMTHCAFEQFRSATLRKFGIGYQFDCNNQIAHWYVEPALRRMSGRLNS